jgi:aminoglycoside 6'-N-acetyltransferase I
LLQHLRHGNFGDVGQSGRCHWIFSALPSGATSEQIWGRVVGIRRATRSDLDDLLPLYVAFFEEDSISTPEAVIKTNLHRMLEDPRACIFVAEEGAGIFGLSSSSLTFGVEFGWAAELEDLFVKPAMRRHGWAGRLTASVLDWAADQGASEAILVVTPEAEQDQNLTRYYQKLGFRDSRRITMYRTLRRTAQ